MSNLGDLYQEIIMDHNNKPRNFQRPEESNRKSEGYNPLCGDQITLYLKVEGDTITDVGFEGAGCAISRASASMMTQSIKGKTREEVEALFEAFHHMVTREPGSDFNSEKLGDLEVLSGIPEFPVRVKCASLSWHTLKAALHDKGDMISTE